MSTTWRDSWERNPVRWSVLLVVAVALAASVTGLANGFAYDDIPVLVENPMVNGLHSVWEYVTDSYWGPSRGNALYRPLTVIVYAVEWAVGGGSPWTFHATSIALYVLSAVATLLLLRELLPSWAALVAGLFWASHPVHVEAVGNIVGQSEMLTAIPLLLAVTAYIHDRRAGALRASTVALIAVLFALALLTKEHGIVLPALLVLAEIALRGRGFTRPAEGHARTWMLYRLLAMTVVLYLGVRYAVLAGFAGDAPHPALQDISAIQRLWVMLGLVPEFVRLFLWPARLYADYSPQAIPFLTSPAPWHLAGTAVLALGAVLAGYGWRRDRVVFIAMLWLVITLGPVSNILLATGVLIAERTLFLPSVGIVLLLGRALVVGWPRLRAIPTRWVQVAVPAMAALLLVTATARSAARQAVWFDNPTLFSTLIVDAPDNFRAHHALGEMFGSAGAWSRAETHLRKADSLFPGYDLLELSLARDLHFADRCPEALPFYDQVLRQRPDAEIALIGRTACLLEERHLSDARDEALKGIGRGLSVGPFRVMLQKAESSLVATDTVDARNRWWRAGAPFSRSDARLRVPVLMMKPAGSPRARKMPFSSPDPPPPPVRDL